MARFKIKNGNIRPWNILKWDTYLKLLLTATLDIQNKCTETDVNFMMVT